MRLERLQHIIVYIQLVDLIMILRHYCRGQGYDRYIVDLDYLSS